MLFSNEAVAAAIHDNFEPVWDSLRPVPRVTIDFGNGNVVRRTLHGNVATWVCAADGTALDVLPGVYEPDAWLREMQELVPVHRDFLAARQTTAGARRPAPIKLQQQNGGVPALRGRLDLTP